MVKLSTIPLPLGGGGRGRGYLRSRQIVVHQFEPNKEIPLPNIFSKLICFTRFAILFIFTSYIPQQKSNRCVFLFS
jgi:hypothetical protein